MSDSTQGESHPQAPMSVIDCSQGLAERFAASMLAGRGAEVLRPGMADPGGDATEMFVSRGVRRVDLPVTREQWGRLFDGADVVLVSGPGGDWGTIDEIRDGRPHLVVVCTTPYGLVNFDPSRPATALTLAAESGFLGITGEPDSAPEALRGHVPEFACGWAIASAAWVALRQRNVTKRGMTVDLSLLEMFVFLQWNSTQRAAFEGVVMQRQGARGLGHPWGVYPCKDGHVILIVGAGGRNWARFSQLMGVPELADPRYESAQARAQHADEIDALMLPWLMEYTAEEIFTGAQEVNLPFGMVRKPQELLSDSQFQARGFFQTNDGLKWPQLPYRLNGLRPVWGAAPVTGGAK